MLSAAASRFGEAWKDFIIEASREHGLSSTNDMRVSAWNDIMTKIIEADPGEDVHGGKDEEEQLTIIT